MKKKEDKKMRKNKKAFMGLAALAAVAVIGGTWAYWNQDLSAVNEFETGNTIQTSPRPLPLRLLANGFLA